MKYAVFDIGNVLCHVNFDKLLVLLSKTFNISRDEAMHFLNRTQKLHDLGLIHLKDEIQDRFKIRSEAIMEELLDEWNTVIWKENAMFDMLADLIANNVQIALLSNIGWEHVSFLDKHLGNEIGYKKSIHFFSCHVGVRKPSLIYYQSFLLLHPKFKGCIYLDDVQDNLDSGKEFGFRTVKFCLDEVSRGNKLKSRVAELKKLILEDI